MSKSQNTKYEQQKDLCITSEQLTEQWKNGDLPAGDYWCEITESPYIEKVYLTKGEDFVVKILAPVPSYEQWKAKLEENTDLKKDFKLMKRLLRRMEESDNAREKFQNGRIEKLKELLKGAKEIIDWYKADCGYRDIPTEVTLQHIKQVLGEE